MKNKTWTYFNLMLMMFFQYLLLAVWWVPLAAYLGNRGIDGFMVAIILSSMAIGSMASLILGAFADRLMSGQKVLALSNVLTGVFILGSAFATEPYVIFILLLLGMLCYMPTWSLTSAIAMAHTDREQFPRIRMFGSIGWIASGLFSVVAIKLCGVEVFDGTRIPMICGAVTAFVAAATNLFLPDTPPTAKGEKAGIGDLIGVKAFSMLKDRNYAVFMAGSFVAMISFALYFSFGSQILQDSGFKYVTVTMNWGQVAELLFLFFSTAIISRAGIKWAMVYGLAALVLRYLSFYLADTAALPGLYIVGILFHGLIFGLFFVGGQVYTDKKAPAEIRSQAQGMLSFCIWGVAMLLGNLICGWMIKASATPTGHNWPPVLMIATIVAVVAMLIFILFFRKEDVKE